MLKVTYLKKPLKRTNRILIAFHSCKRASCTTHQAVSHILQTLSLTVGFLQVEWRHLMFSKKTASPEHGNLFLKAPNWTEQSKWVVFALLEAYVAFKSLSNQSFAGGLGWQEAGFEMTIKVGRVNPLIWNLSVIDTELSVLRHNPDLCLLCWINRIN